MHNKTYSVGQALQKGFDNMVWYGMVQATQKVEALYNCPFLLLPLDDRVHFVRKHAFQ